jgi:hypothetical protein
MWTRWPHLIRKSIAEANPNVVVRELLDNNVFYSKLEDGSRILTKKGIDEIYLIEGELQV